VPKLKVFALLVVVSIALYPTPKWLVAFTALHTAFNTIQYLTHLVNVILPANVTVVSTKLVVNPLCNTVASAFAFTNVPLGLPALSVCILTDKSTHGVPYFLNANFNVVLAVPLQNTGIPTLVLAVIFPISCALVEAANVTISSLNRLSPAVTFSHTR
jgi:hypothetical protein